MDNEVKTGSMYGCVGVLLFFAFSGIRVIVC